MINIGKEWHWMDEITSIEDKLSGWGFDMERLRASEGGAFLSLDRRSPRAFSTNVSNDTSNPDILSEEEWCNYANMPSPSAYMDNS